MMSSSEERRLIAKIADLKARLASQTGQEANNIRNEIAGLEAELSHVRGKDPGKARS